MKFSARASGASVSERAFSRVPYKARNAQAVASLVQACCYAVIKTISGSEKCGGGGACTA